MVHILPILSRLWFSFADSGNTYIKIVPCDPLSNGDPDYIYNYIYESSDGINYSLTSCLENLKDQQKDDANQAPCDGDDNWSFTLQNP